MHHPECHPACLAATNRRHSQAGHPAGDRWDRIHTAASFQATGAHHQAERGCLGIAGRASPDRGQSTRPGWKARSCRDGRSQQPCGASRPSRRSPLADSRTDMTGSPSQPSTCHYWHNDRQCLVCARAANGSRFHPQWHRPSKADQSCCRACLNNAPRPCAAYGRSLSSGEDRLACASKPARPVDRPLRHRLALPNRPASQR